MLLVKNYHSTLLYQPNTSPCNKTLENNNKAYDFNALWEFVLFRQSDLQLAGGSTERYNAEKRTI